MEVPAHYLGGELPEPTSLQVLQGPATHTHMSAHIVQQHHAALRHNAACCRL